MVVKAKKPKAKPVLDIFDELRAVDLRNKDFYDGLTPEQKKAFSSFVLLRWASAADTQNTMLQQWYVEMANKYVNINFWQLTKHPKLQWLLLSHVGCTKSIRHEYIKRNQDKKDKTIEMLKVLYPSMKTKDIELLKSTLSDDDIKTLTNEYDEFKSDFHE